MEKQRLDKIIASTGKYSRREVKLLVRQGRVLVDGFPVRSAEDKFDPERAEIVVNGEALTYRKYTWVMLNKPAGYLSATEDGRGATVLDLLPPELQKQGLFPAGRLDKDSEGLLLLTNDGDTAHRLISPNFHVEKRYFVRYAGMLDADAAERIEGGITIDGGEVCRPGRLVCTAPGEAEVFVTEGKYHQVKRMITACGGEVTYLRRLSFGPLALDPQLHPGDFRFLTAEEEKEILKIHEKLSGKV